MVETIRLPGGRALGYAITGDPAGPPVFYCHGWPASRLEAGLIADMPLRLIAVDRPGYGASDPQPGRRLLDWPADIAALAAHLGIGRFGVIGVSGGGPFALACAAMLPQVTEVALISPVPPLGPRHAPPAATLGSSLTQLQRLGRAGRSGWAVLSAARMAIAAGLVDPQSAIVHGASPRDAALLTPALRKQLVDSWREGLRRSADGAVSDARIYVSDWGFDLASIPVPVTLWHGAEDRIVPPATLVAYAALPATRHIIAGDGHYSLALTRATEMAHALRARWSN